jgi:hypothetical protein
MKLNEALTILKNMKSKLKRTDSYIQAAAVHSEDSAPEYVYEEEVKEHYRLTNDIINLKTWIAKTNVNTTIKNGDQSLSLNELILNNATFRSELAFWTAMLDHTTEEKYASRTKDTVKKVYAAGYSKADIRNRINNLEASKEFVEKLIAKANAETELMQPAAPSTTETPST